MSIKPFDCVEMKRKGAQKITEALKGKTQEEQVAYWRRRNEEMGRWLAQRAEKAAQKAILPVPHGTR